MPPTPHNLWVEGQCEIEQGKSVELRRQASNDPKATSLVLDVGVSGPDVPEGTPSICQDVRYEEEINVEYESVTIRMTVPVQDVFEGSGRRAEAITPSKPGEDRL